MDSFPKIYNLNLAAQLKSLAMVAALSIRVLFKPDPVEWCESNIYLSPRVTPRPGYIRFEPYQKEPIRKWLEYRHSVHCWATQLGKSAMVQAIMGYVVDIDPGPAMIAYPDMSTGRRRSKKHLRVMFEDCPILKNHTTGIRDDLSIWEYSLDRMVINIAWSGSPSALAAEAIRYLFRDETGKFAGGSDSEADSISLSERRTMAYGDMARIFDTSTPTIREMEPWKSFEAGTQSHRYLPCPSATCDKWFPLEIELLEYPTKRDDESPTEWHKRVEEESCMRCPECGAKITDLDIIRMDMRGEWRDHNPGAKIYSTRLPSFYARAQKLGEIALRYVLAQDDPEKMHDFMNSDLAKFYEFTAKGASREMINNHRSDYSGETIPTHEPCIVVMTVDLHKMFQRIVIRAHSFESSYLLHEGHVTSINEAKAISNTARYKDLTGTTYAIKLIIVDMQWMPDWAYDWATEDKRVFPIGSKGLTTGVFSTSHPNENKNINQININEDYFKELLLDSFNSGHDRETGEYTQVNDSWKLPRYVSDRYITEVLAEHVEEEIDKRGITKRVWHQDSRKNHAFDLEKYQCAARYIIRDTLKDIHENKHLINNNPQPTNQPQETDNYEGLYQQEDDRINELY